MARLRDIRRDERGITLIELTVATTAGMIVFFGLTMLVLASMHESTRITDRVHATQNARTALHRLISELHSACVVQYAIPALSESTSTRLAFVHAYGAEVSPTPTKSVITLNGSTLTQTDYAVSGGSAPSWTFSTTASTTRALMSHVAAPSGTTPMFKYSEFSNGSLTPIALSGTETLGERAEGVVHITVTLQVLPPGETVADPNASAEVQDSAYMRFSSPAYTTTAPNLPCE